jgi:ferrochelatase
VGVLLANLGTPDATDYWSMRRYLNEFLSDQAGDRLPRWLWQPLLQLVILSKRPFSSAARPTSRSGNEADESPLMTITKEQTPSEGRRTVGSQLWRPGDGRFLHALRQPVDESRSTGWSNAGCDRILFFPLYPHYSVATWPPRTISSSAR